MRRWIVLLACVTATTANAQQSNVYMELMQQAWSRSSTHGGEIKPAVSDGNEAILSGKVPIVELHRQGFRVLGGISSDPEQLRMLVRAHIDGYITDRPDILRRVLDEEIEKATTAEEKSRLARFDVQAHRGGRGLRPESTLPSFELGMDLGVNTLEMDIGVTTDKVAMIWHDEYFNPKMCRRTDDKPYEPKDRIWLHNMSSVALQKTLICDKIPFGAAQINDLPRSPVTVAFAKKEHLPSPYSPTYVDQLFRFVRFYGEYYRTGPGRKNPHAAKRVAEANHVRFDIETKLIPDYLPGKDGKMERTENNTAEPQAFVTALCDAVVRNQMQSRSEIQSFDFRTLKLVEEQFAFLPTYYLTSSTKRFPYQFTGKH